MASVKEIDNGDGKSRKRLRPLLQKFLNENTIPHLCWTDRQNKIWKLPWKHHKQTRWGDPDAFMLRELAKHLYGYNGPSEPAKEKLKHWKELIRNALRSLKDIKELDVLHVKEGDNPYKVYQFVDTGSEGIRKGRVSGAEEFPLSKSKQGRPSLHETTISVENVHENSLSFTDGTDLWSCSPGCCSKPTSGFSGQGSENHYTVISSDSGGCSQWNANLPENISAPTSTFSYPHSEDSFPGNCAPIDDFSNIPSQNLIEGIDYEDLDILLTTLSFTGISDPTPSFRSRSPLCCDSEPHKLPSISEASVSGVPGKGVLTGGSAFVSETISSHLGVTPAAPNQQADRTDAFHEHRMKTNVCIAECNTVNPGQSQDKSPLVRKLGYSACIDNISMINEAAVIPETHLSLISIGRENMIVPFPLLGTQLQANTFSHQNYFNRIIQAAPPASVVVFVYYHNPFPVACQVLNRKFRICFVADSSMRDSIKYCEDPQQSGPSDALMLELPQANMFPELHHKQARDTQKVLNNLARGVVIDLRGGDIYATRYCKAVPYFSHPGQTDFQKMKRLEEVKVFDFHRQFGSSFGLQQRYQVTRPHARLSFAMRDPKIQSSALTVDIWHVDAYQQAVQTEEGAPSLEPECSISDEYDNQLETEHMLRNTILSLHDF